MKGSRMRSAAAAALLVAMGITSVAMAQEQGAANAQSSADATQARSVTNGNTTIFFEPAGSEGIDEARLRTWGEFAEAHPGIAKSLAYNSSLIYNDAYLAKHQALSGFFEEHPDIKDAMAENPGNFVAIPPRPGE
jgi:hypothetical protein